MKYPKNYLNYLKESTKMSKINTNIDGINFQKNRYFFREN